MYERLKESKGILVIEVKDNGIGISPSAQEKLFTEFERGGEET